METVEQADRLLVQVMGQLGQLANSPEEPPKFFGQFIQLAVAGLEAEGAAVWVVSEETPPQIFCHLNLEKAATDEEEQKESLVRAIGSVVEQKRPMVLPPAEILESPGSGGEPVNHSSYPFFFQPLRVGGKIPMVLQFLLPEGLDPKRYGAIAGIIGQMGEYAQTYLAHRRATVLDLDRKATAGLVSFLDGIHGSLDIEQVAYQIANLARDVLGAKRCLTLIKTPGIRKIRVVSGVDQPNRKAVLVRASENLADHVEAGSEPLAARRQYLNELEQRDPDNPLIELLYAYFDAAETDFVAVFPLRGENLCYGSLVFEFPVADEGVKKLSLIKQVTQYALPAIRNARQYSSVPLAKPLTAMRDKLQKVSRGSKRKHGMIAAAVVVVLAILFLGQWDLTIQADCELAPTRQSVVVTRIDGLVASVPVRDGQKVIADNTVLGRLDETDLQKELVGLELERQRKLLEQRQKRSEGDLAGLALAGNELAIIANRIELQKRKIDYCRLRSPINGIVLTPQIERRVGEWLEKGATFAEVADLDGWQIEIKVSQADIGLVRQALQEEGKPLPIRYITNAWPEDKLFAKLQSGDEISQLAEVQPQGQENTFVIRVPVGKLPDHISAGLKPGTIGRAAVTCGKRSIAFLIFRKVIRFFQMEVFF